MLPWIQQFGNRKKTAILMTIFLAVFFLFSIVLPITVHAQPDTFGLNPIQGNIGLGGGDIRVTIGKIIRAALGLLAIIALCLVLYAGFVIMTAGGDDDKVAQGRKILTNAVIGLVIIFSSLAIVQFILSRLADATGFGSGNGGNGSSQQVENFRGSGALGKLIRDHYPFVNQKNVPRNTRISITFSEPISPETIIENTNGSCWGKVTPAECGNDDEPKLGDCVAPPVGQTPNLERDCDRLIIGDNRGIVIAKKDTPNQPIAAAAMATYDVNKRAASFVFRPLQPLGDAIQPMMYTVRLNNKLKKPNGDLAFKGERSDFYEWQFETGTTLDLTPPTVVSVIPGGSGSAPRNTVVQINFSEPMDPVTVSGVLGSESTFNNIIFNRQSVTGEWRVSNEYKTVEFVSDQPCGLNSCGEEMYCLPVVCDAGESGICTDTYGTLIRTAVLDGTGTFQSFPASGVSDLAGNALDGNPHKSADGKPITDGKPVVVGDGKTISAEDIRANNNDNYSWSYTVRDVIDRSIPEIQKIEPAVDQEAVVTDAPVSVWFNQIMMGSSLYSLKIEEYRQAGLGSLDRLWTRPTFSTTAEGQTIARIDHRAFGPNKLDYYYFTSVPSSVKNIYQNCLYPGRGPKVGTQCTSDNNCTPVTGDAATDTGCANNAGVALTQPDTAACISKLKEASRN